MNKLTRAVKHSISVSSAVAMFRATEIIQGGRAGWVCGNGYLDQQNRNQLLEWLDVVRDSAIKRIKAL